MLKARARRSASDQLGHGAVEHRRGAVEGDADQRQDRQTRGERQRQQDQDASGGQAFGQADRANHPDPRAEQAADRACPPRRRQRSGSSATPITGKSAPFARSRNGRKVRNPIRVALSMMPIASSSGKPRPAGRRRRRRRSLGMARWRPASRPAGRAATERSRSPRPARPCPTARSPSATASARPARRWRRASPSCRDRRKNCSWRARCASAARQSCGRPDRRRSDAGRSSRGRR